MPFIIGGLVLLLVAGGVELFFVLNKDDPTPVATSSTSQSTVSTPDTGSPTEDTQSSTQDSSPPAGQTNYPESESTADTFVLLMSTGDYDTARFLLCAAGLSMFADGQALADDFFGFLGATAVTDSQVTDVHVDPDQPERDLVIFDVVTDVGTVPMQISMLQENGSLTVCGYSTP